MEQETAFLTLNTTEYGSLIDMNMKLKNSHISLTRLCLLVVLVMAAGVFMTACDLGGAPVDESAPSSTSAENVTSAEIVTDPVDVGQEPSSEEGSVPTGEPEGTNTAEPQETVTNASPDTATPTEPAETQPSQPAETEASAPTYILYEQYQVLSGEEQLAYFQSFPSPEDFFIWYNAALADYADRNPDVEIGPDGNIILP